MTWIETHRLKFKLSPYPDKITTNKNLACYVGKE